MGHITSDRKQHRAPDLFRTDGTKRPALSQRVCAQVIDGDERRPWNGARFRKVEFNQLFDGSHTDRYTGVWAEVEPTPK